VSVEEIAKSAADEATKISATEATTPATEEARKTLEEPAMPSGSASELVITDAEMGEAGSDKLGTDVHPSAPEAQALMGPSGQTNQQQGPEAPSSSGSGELSFEDPSAKILVRRCPRNGRLHQQHHGLPEDDGHRLPGCAAVLQSALGGAPFTVASHKASQGETEREGRGTLHVV
jgi:hypothetical protein